MGTQESKDEIEHVKMPSLWRQTSQFHLRLRLSKLPQVSRAHALNIEVKSPKGESMAWPDVYPLAAIFRKLKGTLESG